MDEEVIDDLYNRAKGQGYAKSRDEFIKLLHNDSEVFNDMYSYVKSQGYTKDTNAFSSLIGKGQEPIVEKKNPVVSSATPQEAQPEEQGTTESSLADTSSASPLQKPPQPNAQPQPQQNVQAQVAIPKPEDEGVLSKIGNAALTAEASTLLAAKKTADVVTGLGSNAWKWFLEQSDNIVNAQKNMTKQGGFFDDDIPETDKPISDALKQQLEKSKLKGESPLDPRVIISGIATIANKVINSAIPEKERNAIINNLALTSNGIQSQIRDVEAYQEKVLPKNLPTEVAKNIIGMAPELFLAGKMGGAASAESKAAAWTKKATEKSAPMVAKYAPKAAKVLEESVVAPFTKIMATEATVKSMADTKEGENVFWNGVEGAAKGTVEGMYMHGLGMAAGEVSKPVSKFISKSGINSAIATAIASPLSNAGVFTTARALRTAATEKRMLTQDEAVMEASMGAGFSLLHLKDQFDTHNEANHYYENVLNDDKLNSFGRVINETKANLDLAYNPALTPEKVKELQDARDEIRKAILKEPDLKKKQMLGDEAIKIQNQLDAHNNIQSIVDDKDFIISQIKDQPDLSDQQKTFYINKIQAIADTYDMSDFAVTKRDLNTKITEAQKELDDAAANFTNLKSPSDRAEAKIKIDEKRKQLDELNNQLTELITNKQKQDAIQKQTADEALLRAGRQRLGLQEMGEGNAQSNLTPEQSQAITDEKDAFQEILDNPDNHDESDVQEAKDYFADPIAYYEGKVKFYEEETNPTEDDKAALEHFKSMLEAQKALEVKPETKTESTTIKVGGGATVSESTPEVAVTPTPAKGTTITIGAGGATATTSGKPTEVTTGGEGTETATSGTDVVKTKKNEDNEHTVTLNGKEIGKMYYDPSQKTWQNSNFSRVGEKPNSFKWVYGDILGESKQEAIDELIKRNKETKKEEPQKEEPQKVQFTKDNILNRFLNKLNSLNPLQKNPIDNKSFIYGDKVSLEFNRFDKGDKNEVALESIMSLDKSKGAGKAVMKDIIDAADALGIKLTLDAKPFGREGLTKQQLVDFYKKNGFKVDFEDAFGGEFNSEQELIDYALENESEAIPMSREPKSRGDVTMAEGTETATGGTKYESENTKIEDDGKGNLTVTLDGKPIGRMVYDKEFGNYVNADFNKAEAKPYTSKSFYGDVLGRTQEQAVNELLKRNSEANRGDVTMAEGRETKTSTVDIEKLPGYDEEMGKVDLLVPKYKQYVDRDLNKAKDKLKIAKKGGDDAKIEEAKKMLEKAKTAAEEYKKDLAESKDKALKELMNSDMYKNADPIEQNALAREVAKRFGERQPSAPSAEKITGQPKPEQVTMSGRDILKEQVKAFARGSKQGAQGVRDAITQIIDYIKGTNINTKDLTKVMDVLKSKIETESDLNKAIEKVFDIVDKSNTDIVEVSKTKIDKDKMKAELEGFKKGKRSVVDRVKQIREYFESVKEFGNLTRKDLSKVMREISKVQDEKTLDKAVDNINKIIDNAKTDILEISELKMIKDKMKGIKDAKKDLNEKRKLIAAAIDFIKKSGNVNAKKVGKMLRDIGKVNLEDDTKIEKIIEYAEKVFEDAQYDEKLTKANALKKSISKLSADAKKNVHLTTLGKAFAKLKTSMVDDIDAYIDVASKIKESLVGSKEGDKNDPVRAAEMVNIEESMNYINENMDAQLAKAQEDMAAEVLEKLGVDATGMTIDEMRKMLEEKSDDKKKDQTIIKDGIKKMFDSYTAIIKHIFETGKDPFTGEEIEFDAEQERLVSEFMGMDLDLLDTKKSLEAMDALSNFLQNGSTAKMEDIVMRYKGERNARIAEAKGLKAKQLKFYFNGWMGRTMAEQIATLPTLTEMLFKSQSKSALFDKLSGLTEMRNKKTLVTTMSTALNGRYIKQFYDRKANGKDFTDVSNITERGIIAAVKRTMVGTPEQQQAEFNRKKKLIEDSIDNLKRGVEKERSLAKIYEKAYDKLLKDSNTVDDVLKKADKNNIDAVDFWVREWDAIYDKLSDVSENVYNQILDRDVNYTPDRYTKLYNKGTPEELAQNTSLFNGNNGSVFKKKTGVLEKIERSQELPKNESDKVSRYLDLSFDKTNVNAMHDALMDINTAGVVRQIESFFKSDAIDRIIPNGEDRSILYNDSNTGRVQDFIRASRNKQLIDSTEAAKAARRLSALATIGTSTALGSVWQPLKQVIPVAVNTLINTSGKLDFNYFMGPKAAFLDKVGYGISTRGLESQTQIKSINKLVDLAAKSKGAKAMEYIEKANQFYLKAFLQAPDVYIARASWMSYYEKALEKQGIDPKTIDYESHEVNKDAADYAQKMVDRQQNISDHDLNGKLLGSKKSGTKLITSVVMPFASFRLNQFMRATNDIATLTSLNKDASITPADKRAAAASLAGYTAEMAAFKFIAYSVSLLMGNVTNYIMGKNETEEEKAKRENNLFRGQVTGTITDIFSPIPPADILYSKGADKVLSAVQDLAEVNDEDKFKLMTSTKSNDFAKSFGVLGIGISKYQNLQDAASLAYSGEFTDEYGRKKYIAENDKEALKLVVGLSALANLGLLPADANTIARNAIATAKRGSSTKPSGGEDQEDKETNKENKEAATQNKINVLNDMLTNETDVNKKAAIEEKINSLSQDNQDKKDQQELTAQEKADKEALLGGYDSEEDLKRYNRNLYDINFGPNSDWYQEHKYEKMINEELDNKLQKEEDTKNNYYKSDKNSDGTKKKKKKEYSWSKYKKYSR